MQYRNKCSVTKKKNNQYKIRNFYFVLACADTILCKNISALRCNTHYDLIQNFNYLSKWWEKFEHLQYENRMPTGCQQTIYLKEMLKK